MCVCASVCASVHLQVFQFDSLNLHLIYVFLRGSYKSLLVPNGEMNRSYSGILQKGFVIPYRKETFLKSLATNIFRRFCKMLTVLEAMAEKYLFVLTIQ